jgi:hypothetical protein
MKRILFLSIMVLCISGLRAQDTVSDHYQTSLFDVTIFNKNVSSDFYYHGRRFTPTRHDIDTAEYALREDFKKSKKMNDSIYHDKNRHGLDWYKRQYFGYIEKGRKYLYIVCFPEEPEDYWYKKGDWITKLHQVYDDSSMWSIQYDLKTNKIDGGSGGGVGP